MTAQVKRHFALSDKQYVTDPDEHLPPPPPKKTALGWALLFVKVLAIFALTLAVWWTVRWFFVSGKPGRRDDFTHIVAPLGMALLTMGGAIWQEVYWRRPRRKLLELLPPVCGGNAPIETLKEVGGGMKDVARVASHILHRARSSDRKLNTLQTELDQRVQTRTDALERAIGGLRQQAIRDPLTGLFNRRALDDLLPRLIDSCRSKIEDLALLMIDVDCFKQLNDQLGHAAGDDFLRTFGQLIRSSLARNTDMGFRCGGDEFVIVLAGCPTDKARLFADKLSTVVTSYAKTIRSNPRPGISIGLCSISELPSPVASELLKEADRRLYENKQQRRVARAA